MFIEEILLPIAFVTEQTSTSFFFWLIFLVSSSLSTTTLGFSYFSPTSTNLSKSSKFPILSLSISSLSFSTMTIFSEKFSS